MKLKFSEEFRERLKNQVNFIARDKPGAARKFKSDLLTSIKSITSLPKKHRKSIYFEDESIRDLIYKGYTIIYKIDHDKETIFVFSFLKHQKKP